MNIQEIIQKYPAKTEYLIEMLTDIDHAKPQHFISEKEVGEIAEYLQVKESVICSVMSFYTLLSTKPRGQYVIQVCKDVPCYINDNFNVLKTIEDFLGISLGEMTKDQQFSLEQTACIGCCDQAPAMRINHDIYTNLTKQKVLEIIGKLGGEQHD